MWEKYFQKTFLQWNFWLHGVNTLGLACSPRVHHQFMMSRNCRYSECYRFSKYSRSSSRSNMANKFKWYCRPTTWFGLFEFFNVHYSMFMHWVDQLSLIKPVAMVWTKITCCRLTVFSVELFLKLKVFSSSHLTAAARSARSKGVILEQFFLLPFCCTTNKVESSCIHFHFLPLSWTLNKVRVILREWLSLCFPPLLMRWLPIITSPHCEIDGHEMLHLRSREFYSWKSLVLPESMWPVGRWSAGVSLPKNVKIWTLCKGWTLCNFAIFTEVVDQLIGLQDCQAACLCSGWTRTSKLLLAGYYWPPALPCDPSPDTPQ